MSETVVGTEARPLRVAIIGSGPAGFYAANALLKADVACTVDMFDRLPTPFGLVRGGVAPDHQKIKAVIRAYDKTAEDGAFRFIGNVNVGVDVSVDALGAHYDGVIWAIGAESDNHLHIPGEDLPGSVSATSVVGWYNAHPDHVNGHFDLTHPVAVVVGVGNVAMDVARVLARSAEELAATDISDEALEAIRGSGIREVHVLGRRGIGQVAFSPLEIKELAELEGVALVVDEAELDPSEEELAAIAAAGDSSILKNLEFLKQHMSHGPRDLPRKVVLHLRTSPIEIHGDGKVERITLGRNTLSVGPDGYVKAVDSGERSELACGLVIRAVGYRGTPLPGLPFDARRGRIPNEDGRVAAADGELVGKHYVVGWAKRGPSGLIGTNRADSQAVVGLLLEDLVGQAPASAGEPATLLNELLGKGVQLVSYADWKRLDKLEQERGAAEGRVRKKFARIADMLQALRD